jgi:phosphoribosylformylglycinamidine synthase
MPHDSRPRALIIRTAGTNCDAEMVRAFDLAGAAPSLIHVDRLIANPQQVADFDLIGFPGGFSYGDDIASGRILAMKLREKLYPALRDAARRGVPMIGACNGFQVMVQVGLLPGPNSGAGAVVGRSGPATRSSIAPDWPEDSAPPQSASLSFNAAGRFIDRWVGIAANPNSPCIWTQGLTTSDIQHPTSDIMVLPIAHGEGRFVTANPEVLKDLQANNQIALTYADNPNGSQADIAGICDPSGRIFGLMPHPERYLDWTLHPFWTRLDPSLRQGPTPGLKMFQNAVQAVQRVPA